MPVNIEIQNLQTKVPIKPALFKTDIHKVLINLKLRRGNLSFVFLDDRRIRTLNRDYLRHDYSTDVLAFDLSSCRARGTVEGEIIISAETAKRHSAEYGTSLREEVLRYMIHGVLHLLGYDDHSPAEIKKMRAKEQELVDLINM